MEQIRSLSGIHHEIGSSIYSVETGPRSSVFSEAICVCILVGSGVLWEVLNPSPSLLLMLGLGLISYINYLVGARDVLYPAFMFTTIWTLVSGIYYFCPIDVDPLGAKTVSIFLAGAASFSIGGFLGNRPLIRARSSDRSAQFPVANSDNPQARNILFAVTLSATILFLFLVIRLAGGISGLNLSFILKLNSPKDTPLEYADPVTKIIAGSGGFLPVLTLWTLIMEERRKWKIALCAICAILFPLFVTQRGLVMTALCGCVTLFLLKTKDRRCGKMVVPLGTTALGIVVLMGAMSFTKYWVQSGELGVTTAVWRYIAGPFAAFNYAVYHPTEFEDQSAAVLTQVITPLANLQIIHYRTWEDIEGSPRDRFVEIPFAANVYTAYKPYYQDFGAFGCFAAFALFGLIEGALFYSAVRGNPFAILFLVHLSTSLMFSTFDDDYHGFSRDLNVIVFAVGYFWIMKRIRFSL